MAEDLQYLIDRIQTEGVQEAENRARDIESAARGRASEIVQDAEGRAEAIVQDARTEADKHRERAERALQQTARDLLLALTGAVRAQVSAVLDDEAAHALSDDAVAELVADVVHQLADADTVRLPADKLDKLEAHVRQRLRDRAEKTLDLAGDDGLLAGFRVGLSGGSVYMDFSAATVAEAMARMVNPRLGATVREAGTQAMQQAQQLAQQQAQQDAENGA